MARARTRERLVPIVLTVAGAALWGVAAFMPMLVVWSMQPGEEPISLWDLMSVADASADDYDPSGAGTFTYLVTFGPIVLAMVLSAMMLFGSTGTFRAACAGAVASSATWLAWVSFSLAWMTGLLSQMVSGQPPEFNMVRWLLLLGPVLCLIGGAVGFVSYRSDLGSVAAGSDRPSSGLGAPT